MSFWLVQLVRLHWHPRLGVVLLVGFVAGFVAALYVVGVMLAPELSVRRMLLPVAVIVFMGGGLQYVAVRRLGRSPWAFSLAYALPFLFWTLLFVGDVVPLAFLGFDHDAGARGGEGDDSGIADVVVGAAEDGEP